MGCIDSNSLQEDEGRGWMYGFQRRGGGGKKNNVQNMLKSLENIGGRQ